MTEVGKRKKNKTGIQKKTVSQVAYNYYLGENLGH